MGINIKGIILCLAATAALVMMGISAFTGFTSAEDISSNYTQKYILGEFEGNLAIYEGDEKTPIEVLDVRLDSLPERDIERIKNGISAESLSEIISLAEDYE